MQQRVLRFFRREDAEDYARLFGGRVCKPWWSRFWQVKNAGIPVDNRTPEE